MKKSFLLFLSIGILFTSCENQLDNLPVEEIGQELKTKVVVKFNTTKALDVEETSNVFDVSIEELKAYMANQTIMSIPSSNPNARTISQETIEPIVSGTDTVMYLVNYPEGWCLFSGDKRTPAILVYSETGSMSQDELNENPGRSLWIKETHSYIEYLKSTIEYDEDSQYLREWADYDDDISIKTISNSEEDYTWVFVRDEEISNTRKNILPVLRTSWHQYAPWNQYAPYKKNSTTERCPAGCLAIAVAQLMYHFHYSSFGKPVTMPSIGYSYGDYDNNTYSFSSPTSSVFDQMARSIDESGTDKSALMIGYIGRLLGTQYRDNESGATLESVPGVLAQNQIGISCELSNYNGTTAFNMISFWGTPVLIGATDQDNSGHAWIMDGGKYNEYIYEKVYAFVNDSIYLMTGVIPEDAEYRRERITEKKNMYTLMNWGYEPEDNYFEYYPIFDQYWPIGSHLYNNNNKKMIIFPPYEN